MDETSAARYSRFKREGDLIRRAREIKELTPFDRRNFAPVEHCLIGSTPTINDQVLNARELIGEAQKGNQQALKLLLTPIRILEEGSQSMKAVQRSRTAERENRTARGALVILSATAQVELEWKKGVDIYLEPNPIDGKSGHVDTQWRVLLLDEKGNEATEKEYWKGIDVIEPERERFILEEVPGANYRLLKLRLNTVKDIPKAA